LDLGTKTIGAAVSDELGWTAQPLTVLARQGLDKDTEAVIDLVNQYQAEKVVLGLPWNMDGTLGKSGQRVKAFGRHLAERMEAELVYWDERWTTVSAERVLLQADLSRAKRKKVIDKLAASLILQGYLDHLAVKKETR
jgi:putative Holliday junction resolvase